MTPILQHSISPVPHHSITPTLHHSVVHAIAAHKTGEARPGAAEIEIV
jgi:hypothetical protein